MQVKEMHIEVNQALQKLGANLNRKLFDNEVDWVLNKGQQRFIQSRVTPRQDGSGGYELTSFNIDAIRPLMQIGVEQYAFVADPRRYSSLLPGDYEYIISDESVMKKPISGMTPVKKVLTDSLVTIPLIASTATSQFYKQVQITLNGQVEFDIQAYATQRGAVFNGWSSSAEIYNLPTLILLELKAKGWNAYWEYYGNRYYPKSLIVVANSGSALIDGVSTPGTAQYFSYQVADYPQRPTEESNNRLCASSVVQNLRPVAFYKTQADSPISELQGNQLYVYADNTFIVTNTRLSYVRKARRIDLSLNQDCELSSGYHPLICDLTVEYVKGIIADPNWEVKLKDNMTRTNL